jgi:polyferredoxin
MNSFMTENLSVTQTIQLILAPGVMINACGLLLLSIGNKFSSVLNRIRILNDEKRRLIVRAAEPDYSTLENQRVESIERQLHGLLKRARWIRNAVSCYFVSVGLFVLTSLLIGADFFLQMPHLKDVIIVVFLFGMIVVFLGVVFGVLDTMKGYDIVKFEVQVDE